VNRAPPFLKISHTSSLGGTPQREVRLAASMATRLITKQKRGNINGPASSHVDAALVALLHY